MDNITYIDKILQMILEAGQMHDIFTPVGIDSQNTNNRNCAIQKQ